MSTSRRSTFVCNFQPNHQQQYAKMKLHCEWDIVSKQNAFRILDNRCQWFCDWQRTRWLFTFKSCTALKTSENMLLCSVVNLPPFQMYSFIQKWKADISNWTKWDLHTTKWLDEFRTKYRMGAQNWIWFGKFPLDATHIKTEGCIIILQLKCRNAEMREQSAWFPWHINLKRHSQHIDTIKFTVESYIWNAHNSNVDKSNWLVIVEYDFDNNRHGFVVFIRCKALKISHRQWYILRVSCFGNRINVTRTTNTRWTPIPEH